ncbi:MAG: CotH kinase family protein [Verrucomicrobiota bacterium]
MRRLSNLGWILAIIAIQAQRGVISGQSDQTLAKQLFDEDVIPKIQLDISAEGLERLRQRPRKYVVATVREGAKTYTNVCVRLKGGPGSFRSLDDKPAWTLNFGRQAPGQRFHGLKKFHLNNSVQDHTYLCEKISRELFDAAGVPAPRAGHAWVQMNGRNLGFYVLIEGIDKHFFKRYFTDTGGNLYDGHSGNDVTGRMGTNSGDVRTNHVALLALARAAREPDLELRLARLEETLDVDRFLSFLATEVMLCHWDGYAMNRNNFRVFHDRDKNRMVFLPQGVDQVFQRQNTPVFPPMVGFVAKSVLEVPELRTRYRARMAELLTNVWNVKVLTNRLYEVGQKVQASIAEGRSPSEDSYQERVHALSRRVQRRVRELERALTSPAAAPRFDSDGIVQLSDWQPKIDIGSPSLRKEQPDQKSTWLYIGAGEKGAGSWRTRVVLDRGRYRFHGRMRLQDVVLDSADLKSGAGLRISRGKFARQLKDSLPWTTVSFDFTVNQDRAEVELVCELRAAQGEVWFDEGSLRLIQQEQ